MSLMVDYREGPSKNNLLGLGRLGQYLWAQDPIAFLVTCSVCV